MPGCREECLNLLTNQPPLRAPQVSRQLLGHEGARCLFKVVATQALSWVRTQTQEQSVYFAVGPSCFVEPLSKFYCCLEKDSGPSKRLS